MVAAILNFAPLQFGILLALGATHVTVPFLLADPFVQPFYLETDILLRWCFGSCTLSPSPPPLHSTTLMHKRWTLCSPHTCPQTHLVWSALVYTFFSSVLLWCKYINLILLTFLKIRIKMWLNSPVTKCILSGYGCKHRSIV